MAEVTRYPLAWPTTHARRKRREIGEFVKDKKPVTIAGALGRLDAELERIGAKDAIISSNVETRLDGLPRSDRAEPSDPGVALYFTLKGKPHCLPCDTYTQNIAALANHIDATRRIERYGVATLAEQFTGFQALPAPGKATSQQWRNVLRFNDGTTVSVEAVSARYRQLAKERATSEAALAELNVARDEALKELST